MTVRRTLVTTFGLGLLKPAPGTWGSVPPPALVLLLLWSGASSWTVNAALILIAVMFSACCVAFGRWAEHHFNTKDPRQVVADETAGQSLALLFLPWRDVASADGWVWNITVAATAFVAFRLFDIAKPPPLRAVQRIRGGWGILVDDVLAGLYALGVTHLMVLVVWPGVPG